MADPKLMRIMKTLAGRVENIRVSNAFNTDIGRTVKRYPRVFNQEECPASSIFLGGGSNGGSQGTGVKTDPELIIRASIAFGDDEPEDVAISMMADIHKAIELPSSTIPQQPDLIRNINETSWQIVYPDNVGDVVSVELTYSFSYSRKYGED